MKQKRLWPLAALFLGLFCVSAYLLASYYLRGWQEEKAFQALARQLEQGGPQPPEPGGQALLTAENGVLLEYSGLYEQNHDLFGWVAIEGTELNYPVMHTPDEPEYYLRRAFDGSSAQSGTPFLDARCFPGCGNYILYGHRMNNGTMFAGLLRYADKEFWQQHPVIRFDTLYEKGEYAVLAAFYSKNYPPDAKGVFRYHAYTDLRDEESFDAYLREVERAALYDTGVSAAHGEPLLTLSTCSYHTENGRFVVVAKKLAG